MAIGKTIAEDSQGDAAYVDQQGLAPPLGAPTTEQIDLSSFSLEENEADFLATISFHDPGQANSRGFLFMHFAHGKQQYSIEAGAREANLFTVDSATEQKRKIAPLEIEENTLQTVAVSIPREFILDETGAPPSIGTNVTQFVVEALEAEYSAGNDFDVRVIDRMPDAGFGVDFVVSTGEISEGGVRVYSPSPSRASNGASTSFLYPVYAENTGSEPRSFALSIKDAPESWDIQMTPTQFAVGAGDRQLIPVIVSIPFRHAHGDIESATLRLESIGEPEAYGETSLRIQYYEVPQPTGHHDRLWIHAKSSGHPGDPGDGILWETRIQPIMNAKQDDPEAMGVAIPGQPMSTVAAEYRWVISLDPSLRMGLDFDLFRAGLLSLELESPIPVQSGTVHGLLYLVKEDFEVIGALNETSVSLGVNTPASFSIPLTIYDNADFIAYDGAAELMLVVFLDAGIPGTTIPADAPTLLPGSTLDMPLHEYRDPIEAVFLEKQSWTITSEGPLQKNVNPGNLLLFPFQVTNDSPAVLLPSISVTGVQEEWATVLGGPTEPLDPSESAPFWVAIDVPEDAQQDMAADLFVSVTADLTSPSFVRILGLVDEESTHPDDREALAGLTFEESKATPWPAVFVLMVLVARRAWYR